MSVNIKGLTAAITDSGVLRNNLYTVKIEVPPILMNSFGTKSDALIPRVDRVTLPSRQIRGIMQKSSYRELRMIPTSYQNLEDLSMSIILSTDQRERKMFLGWQNLMANTSGIPSYIDNVTGKIEIKTHGTNSAMVHRRPTTYIFEDAFPMMVADLEMAASDEEVARLTVIFQYRNWVNEGVFGLTGQGF